MKKFIFYIAIFNILFLNLSFFTLETAKADNTVFSDQSYFVVTAYYSPLPNQNYYFKWSYEADIKLNWKWIRWASWKEVFAWMLAAPKSYAFWTKIYLEWVWIWEVADRWWAIVSTNPSESRWYEYDRIDIWMWYGEEWLARALTWWKRTIKWNILADSETAVSINLSNFPAPESALKNLAKKQEIEKEIAKEIQSWKLPEILSKYVWPESSKESIEMLQEVFQEMWIYTWYIDGKYDSLKESLINYQLKTWVIKDVSNDWAWYFWPKTQTQIQKDYLAYVEKNKAEIEAQKKIEAQLAYIKTTVEKTVNNHINNIWNPKIWDIWENVRTLQKTLKTLGYFKVKDSAIFGDTTKKSIISYQIKKGIINSEKDDWAWVFGPKTKETLKTELATVLENQILKQKNLLSYKK